MGLEVGEGFGDPTPMPIPIPGLGLGLGVGEKLVGVGFTCEGGVYVVGDGLGLLRLLKEVGEGLGEGLLLKVVVGDGFTGEETGVEGPGVGPPFALGGIGCLMKGRLDIPVGGGAPPPGGGSTSGMFVRGGSSGVCSTGG